MQYSTQSLSKLIFFLRIPLAMFKTHGKLNDFDKEVLKVISSKGGTFVEQSRI